MPTKRSDRPTPSQEFIDRWFWQLSKGQRGRARIELDRLLKGIHNEGRAVGWDRAMERMVRLIDENKEG